jgi:hypothetical protein
MTFAISMSVRRDDPAFKQEIQDILQRRKTDIDAILDTFHVPRLADQIAEPRR